MNSTLEKNIQLVAKWRKSPSSFVQDMWGLTPQKTKDDPFTKGKNITWQQYEILLAVERAINGGSPRISVAAGHGIGKSACVSWLIIWFLFCYKDAQVPCTAPTSDQLHDVLWKELSLWLGRLPEPIQKLYQWQTGYLRMTQRPETWFARAKTARKEAPEALAGIHADHVLAIVDEASGVDDVIYRTAEGIFTNPHIFVVLISNPTRLTGYFYDTHHSDKENWQTLSFTSLDSPIVDLSYNARIEEKHGRDSDEYRIRVLGEFPRADMADEQGYIPLFAEADIRTIQDPNEMITFSNAILGIDPAGDGDDKTVLVVRDMFRAKVVAVENKSTPKSIALLAVNAMEKYKIPAERVFVDSFGVGADVVRELVIAGHAVQGVNGGDRVEDPIYLNLRSQMSWEMRQWVIAGGQLVAHTGWKELLSLRYRRELSGKIKIKSKDEMRKDGVPSPNYSDALSYTFVIPQLTNMSLDIPEEPVDSFGLFSI